MKKYILFAVVLFVVANDVAAQQKFINKANIEFELKTNNYKRFDSYFDNNENESNWQENYKSNTTKYSIAYYNYSFANNKSIYTFDRLDQKNKSQWDNDADYEGNIWYYDFTAGNCAFKRSFWRDEFNFTDSIKDIEWKLVPTESRIIAGFNCRKAFAVLFDSVYVFAFYTDEITISGGPVGLHGLPGMILGVTVPRMYSSWIATKVDVVSVDEKKIESPATKKSKSKDDVLKKFMKRAAEEPRWMNRYIWDLFL